MISIETISDLEDFKTQVQNLILALSVAHIESSVDVLEDLIKGGRPTAAATLERLAEELETKPELREAFRLKFGDALSEELQVVFGTFAGEAIFTRVSDSCTDGNLRRLIGTLGDACVEIHRPLIEFYEAQKHSRTCHAELVRAIAESGIETITAFHFVDRVRTARAATDAALTKLNRVAADS